MRHGVACFLMIAVVVAPWSVEAQERNTAARALIDDVELDRAGFRRFWDAQLPIAPGSEIRYASLVDDILYAVITDGTLFAIQADVGLIRWADRITGPDFTIFPPSHVRTADGNGPTLVATTTVTFLFDRYDGAQLARFRMNFPPGGRALAIGNRLFSGGADGRFYSYVMPVGGLKEPYKAWEVLVGAPVTASPILYDRDTLLFAAQNGGVYSCLASDKSYLWSFRTGSGVEGDPAVDASGAYVASADRSLYKLNLRTGQLIWRVRFETPLLDGPVPVAHTVFQRELKRGMIALDADSGQERWSLAGGRKLASHHRMGDVLFTENRQLAIVDHETGDVHGRIDTPAAMDVVTNVNDDAVYVVGSGGRISCIRLDDVPYLRRQQVEAARVQLNLPPPQRSELDDFPASPAREPRDPASRDPFRSERDRRP
jgi:outer membrane protein assembly factor BamB